LLNSSDVTILSVFQLVQEIPYDYFDKNDINFDKIYAELLKMLFKELSLQEYKRVRIVIDSRKHPGGVCYRLILGAFMPSISGHLACFLILTWSEHLPFRCLNFGQQSVNGFVRLLTTIPLSQRIA